MKASLFLAVLMALFFGGECWAALAGPAPNGPGMIGVWSRPDKEGFLASEKENVWATISEGILNEVFYPTIDTAQTKDTQLLFVVGNKAFLEERRDFAHQVKRYPHSLAYHISSQNDAYGIHIEKDIMLDPDRPAVILNYAITFSQPAPVKIYVLHNSACDNTAGGDAMYVNVPPGRPGELMAFQSDRRGDEPAVFANRTSQLLVLSQPAETGAAGFEGVNDPWTQIHRTYTIMNQYQSAVNGNVAGALGFTAQGPSVHFGVVIAFTQDQQNPLNTLRQTAAGSFQAGAGQILQRQQAQWSQYLGSLNSIGQQLEPHVLVLKGLEDKIYKGAIIAGPAIPSLPDHLEAVETDYETARLRLSDANGGYHRVWPRDAVQMSLGLLAAGDTQTPLEVLRYLAQIQHPSGTFPQNVWVNGQVSWNAFQLDQTGFPIILTSRLVEAGIANYSEFRGMVINAADALVKMGPMTDQDRWEENSGLSPNSIAVACQALNEAAWLERQDDPNRSEVYASTCQKWKDSILAWTYVTNGPLGGSYFERIEVADDPTHSHPILIHNSPVGGDTYVESSIIDGGFLQWILSGLVPPLDPHFTSSIQVYDRVARGTAPRGMGYLRYNHDGYGPGHQGNTWPLLSGERALAAIERNEDPQPYIQTMLSSVSPAGIICEQNGISVCPLGWAHAEMLLVARSLADHKSFYIPNHAGAGYQFIRR